MRDFRPVQQLPISNNPKTQLKYSKTLNETSLTSGNYKTYSPLQFDTSPIRGARISQAKQSPNYLNNSKHGTPKGVSPALLPRSNTNEDPFKKYQNGRARVPSSELMEVNKKDYGNMSHLKRINILLENNTVLKDQIKSQNKEKEEFNNKLVIKNTQIENLLQKNSQMSSLLEENKRMADEIQKLKSQQSKIEETRISDTSIDNLLNQSKELNKIKLKFEDFTSMMLLNEFKLPLEARNVESFTDYVLNICEDSLKNGDNQKFYSNDKNDVLGSNSDTIKLQTARKYFAQIINVMDDAKQNIKKHKVDNNGEISDRFLIKSVWTLFKRVEKLKSEIKNI